jgi:WD40 repeat protein/DNA-binding XRE family transcriptional regulator
VVEALSFQSLAVMLRGRAGLTQREVATAIGASERSVQLWEAGAGFPSAASLQRLIAEYLARGGFNVGSEMAEAVALWESALISAPRLRAPFDADWFRALLQSRDDPTTGGLLSAGQRMPSSRDWGEAPAVSAFYGRELEQAILQRWVVEDQCRLVGLCGMGGIGKTALAARLAQVTARQFEAVFWRSLRNAPPCAEWLAEAILFLSDQRCLPSGGEAARRRQLLDLLRERRCLLVLDNLETILEPGATDLRYRDEYAGYGEVLQMLGEAPHRGCVVLTSREEPSELVRLVGPEAPVRVLRLAGLGWVAGQALLVDKGLAGSTERLSELVDRCHGNPLALQLIGELIATLFSGDIEAFLLNGGAVGADIGSVLQTQVERLSSIERALYFWLAIEREPVDARTLLADLGPGFSPAAALEALHALARRSLLEVTDSQTAFTLQPVVLEHATEKIVSTAVTEITRRHPAMLMTHALVKAQCKEYVRRTQERLIARPLLERLSGVCADQPVDRLLVDLLEHWRDTPEASQGFGPGNVVTLLRLHRGNLQGLDLSRLLLRQVDLASVEAQDVSLVDATLENASVAQQFGATLSARLSSDGSHLAIGTLAGEIRVWRLSDWRPVLLAHTQTSAWGIDVSDDGRVIAACGSSDAVYVWDSGRMPEARPLQGGTYSYWCIALSGDGRWLVSGSADGKVRIWETRADGPPRIMFCHTGGVRSVALSHDGQRLATRGADGHVAVWDVQTCQQVADLGEFSGDSVCVALSADGRMLATGDASGFAYVLDATSGQRRAVLRGHTGFVWASALSADGSVLATGGEDRTLRLWNTRTGECQRVLHEHPAGISMVSLSGDGCLVSSVTVDGSVHVWDASRGGRLIRAHGNVPATFGVAFNLDASRAATGSGDGTVRMWDVRSGGRIREFKGHKAAVWSVACAADGATVMSGSLDRTVRVWDVVSGACRAELLGHSGAVTSIALSPDERVLASTGIDGTVRLWDLCGGGELRTIGPPHLAGVRTLRFGGDGDFLLTGELDGTAHIWDAHTGECVRAVQGVGGPILAVAMSADGSCIAWAEPGGVVRVCETVRGANERIIGTSPSVLRTLAMSRDARTVIAGGVDGTLQVWDVESGRLSASLQAHSAEVWSIVVSATDNIVASAGLDGTARVWKLDAGMAELVTLRPDRPYERMDISGVRGVTDVQRLALRALGAVAARDGQYHA